MHMVTMSPAPGECLLRYVGDRVRITLQSTINEGHAFVRTNLGRAMQLHAEIVREYQEELARWGMPRPLQREAVPPKGISWRDIPMRRVGESWELELATAEVGFFSAKAYWVDERGRQIWPHGPNVGIAVHPAQYRCANTIYCAFTRMFGENKHELSTISQIDPHLARLDKLGYSVIPPSGRFRDLIKELPHIFGALGCRILHLLPVNPTPTTYARFGRFGSPYACEDLMAVDPALVEFDRRTTGIDQFKELTYAVHSRGGLVFLDIVINHTGWGSTLQENHPEWFLRNHNEQFESPGAWGTIWEDLVELDHRYPFSWDYLAEVFLTWCERGVDGFRCDAGYKVPTAAWRYIIARVRHEFPDTLFLLEGLGGAWEATEDLLTRGGMQWAYSELFQNYEALQVSGYMDHSIQKSETVGLLVHYSETHDNERLAARGKSWSKVRNQLCALASHAGAFGFTNGVEWLATERVNVHSARGLAWGNADNLISELAHLNSLLAEHPAFFDGAKLQRVSATTSQIYALERVSASGEDKVLVLVNLSPAKAGSLFLPLKKYKQLGSPKFDLLNPGKQLVPRVLEEDVEFLLAPGEALCVAATEKPIGLAGARYRLRRAQQAWAVQALAQVLEPEAIGHHDWPTLAERVEASPRTFLAQITGLKPEQANSDLIAALEAVSSREWLPQVIEWSLVDLRRITPVPPGHWLLIEDSVPFRAALTTAKKEDETAQSVQFGKKHYAFFPPRTAFKEVRKGEFKLYLERYGGEPRKVMGKTRFLQLAPGYDSNLPVPISPRAPDPSTPLVLLTNGRGGMARMCVDLGGVKSKYDCVLGANLHPNVPVDRHIFVKRLRLWANADHFISAMDGASLTSFEAGPPARWEFTVNRGDTKTAKIELLADMLQGRNTTIFRLRLLEPLTEGVVRVTARFDIEDRNFHTETRHNAGSEAHFSGHVRPLGKPAGFHFAPPGDRQVRVYTNAGEFHPEPEWSQHIRHTVEQTRGQPDHGDAYSPGWFDIPLKAGEDSFLVASADPEAVEDGELQGFEQRRQALNESALAAAGLPLTDLYGRRLAIAAQAYVVRRGKQKTVIAGYPWFLDWGRDSLICARGLMAAGLLEEVRQLLITFGRFEKQGTLPNTIHGEDASNRDTSDAPLWYGVVCEELAARSGAEVFALKVDENGRTVADVLRSIAVGYATGTPNGIKLDEPSGLIWSPAHFTWMDTNYPAGTPREGYPIEIQALWIKLLRLLDKLGEKPMGKSWKELADLATASMEKAFWSESKGWFGDCLLAKRGTVAAEAKLDDTLRSNCLFPIAFEQLSLSGSRSCVEAARRYLVIPGALRSLAPLPVSVPLEIHGPDWRLLNNPLEPYWGRYEGDEDTQRKAAYHNGTAWTWTFPIFCEALLRAYQFSPEAVAAAKAYVGSMQAVLEEGCLGHIPEIMDGDVPHQARGCDAQAWGVTEALRIWELLQRADQNPVK